jgi:hypothetical protein
MFQIAKSDKARFELHVTTRKIAQISFKYVVTEMKHVTWKAGSHAPIPSIYTLCARNAIQVQEF